jgi:thiol-disulfide isomerase/thioredoxin
MKTKKVLLSILAVVAIAVLVVASPQFGPVTQTATSAALRSPALHGSPEAPPMKGDFPPLTGATEWLNSAPLSPPGLRGKVVLVEFWTYTCINWLRAHPYVRAWADKYRDQGLVVIGVHSPEFEFEKNVVNVRRAVKDMAIGYPVAVDSDHEIWRAFRNQAWPAFYFIDAQGRMRHRHYGEGQYDQSERVLQQLLVEAGSANVSRELAAVTGRGLEAAADWDSLKSGENYLGHARTENFASPGGAVPGQRRAYAAPARLALNQWALSGDWTMNKEATVLNAGNGRLVYRFHARDVHLVMGPAKPGSTVRFRVLIDGQPPGAARGTDLDERGSGTVSEQRLYQLIRQPQRVIERQLTIEFLDPGAELYAFTFG